MNVETFLFGNFEPVTESGCWIWLGASHDSGYGVWRKRRVHREFYRRLVGPIPDGLVIDHLCRVKCCVNPAHMEPVTNAVNILRGVSKPALNARKTHCLRGHEFTLENTVQVKNGKQCKECCRIRDQKYKQSHRALINAKQRDRRAKGMP